MSTLGSTLRELTLTDFNSINIGAKFLMKSFGRETFGDLMFISPTFYPIIFPLYMYTSLLVTLVPLDWGNIYKGYTYINFAYKLMAVMTFHWDISLSVFPL